MPRKPCYWTRKLELELVEFVRQREFIWKPIGNTNYHIQQKYKAYTEFAAKLGRGLTARSVRDRWVNIRSTFNHNLRRVIKSKITAKTPSDVYIPCWPLWIPLQFLKDVSNKEAGDVEGFSLTLDNGQVSVPVNDNEPINPDNISVLNIRQRGQRTDRPKWKSKSVKHKTNKCKRILDDLIMAMKPLTNSVSDTHMQSYWFFGKHVTERLNAMREEDAVFAGQEIMKLLEEIPSNDLN